MKGFVRAPVHPGGTAGRTADERADLNGTGDGPSSGRRGLPAHKVGVGPSGGSLGEGHVLLCRTPAPPEGLLHGSRPDLYKPDSTHEDTAFMFATLAVAATFHL